jgi:nucleoside-diphosphate-sugar epimerase
MKKTVSIFGGGWVGAPLAFKLALADFEVQVSASSAHKQAAHPNIKVLDFRAEPGMPEQACVSICQSDIHIWAIPPRRKKNSEEHYLEILGAWVQQIDPSITKKIIFLSSTSIYQNVSDIVTEESDIQESSLMAKAEAIVQASEIPSLMLRLGGLMGGDRYVAKYFSGKRNDGANCPVNYIHKDDVVALIAKATESIQEGLFNVVAPQHPSKMDVGIYDCEQRGLPIGLWDDTQPCLGGKIVSGDAIAERLHYTFKWPDPLEFPR